MVDEGGLGLRHECVGEIVVACTEEGGAAWEAVLRIPREAGSGVSRSVPSVSQTGTNSVPVLTAPDTLTM